MLSHFDILPYFAALGPNLTTHQCLELRECQMVKEPIVFEFFWLQITILIDINFTEQSGVCHFIWHLVYLIHIMRILTYRFINSSSSIVPFFFRNICILVGKMAIIWVEEEGEVLLVQANGLVEVQDAKEYFLTVYDL